MVTLIPTGASKNSRLAMIAIGVSTGSLFAGLYAIEFLSCSLPLIPQTFVTSPFSSHSPSNFGIVQAKVAAKKQPIRFSLS